MKQRKGSSAAINKAMIIINALFSVFFLGAASYFQIEAYLLNDPIIFYDLWITGLLFVGMGLWLTPSTEDKLSLSRKNNDEKR